MAILSAPVTGSVIAATILVVAFGSARCQPPHGGVRRAEAGPVTPTTLAGAWSGRWTADGETRSGSAGLVLTSLSSGSRVMGHFTFVRGARTHTARREGAVVDGALRFSLVDGGQIVLRPVDADHLVGEFVDRRGVLPTVRGVLDLTRAWP